jgi:hypothetical protein
MESKPLGRAGSGSASFWEKEYQAIYTRQQRRVSLIALMANLLSLQGFLLYLSFSKLNPDLLTH